MDEGCDGGGFSGKLPRRREMAQIKIKREEGDRDGEQRA